MFYSQFGEDIILSRYFNENYKGVCVEVGAYDGISGSNTYHFEQKGWNSLCIEPTPESFKKCNLNRKHSLNYCISDYDKDDIDYCVVTINGDNTSAISSLTLDERLIDSHKHMINSIDKINVKVKTLNSIFKETDFPKSIDFISIDTENTEIDVLKGLDFNEYEVKIMIIENNFNDPEIEEYLKTKNFKKILRNAVNDFYVNNNYLNKKILNTFDIIHANYYIHEDNTFGVVTDYVKLLKQKFDLSEHNINSNTCVCNDIFTDTFDSKHKQLYITIENNINNKLYKFSFNEGELLNFNKIYDELRSELTNDVCYDKNLSRFISIGELIDKFSILELKLKYISKIEKLKDIQKEIDILSLVINDKNTYFYKLLLHINELIWINTDIIKKISLKNEDYENILLFSQTSNIIFQNNQKRFRLKQYFNIITSSDIKEHKSYNEDKCYIQIKDINEIYQKIAEINYLCISHDIIYIDVIYKNTFNNIFKNPNIHFSTQNETYETHYNLESFTIDDSLKQIYDFEPIKYISGGHFGDFLNQLSVVSEKFYDTGKKGILYINNLPQEHFLFGLENTYNDTYNTIISQEYIKDYKIYNNELIDINLSTWRHNIYKYNEKNWRDIYSNEYNINWGKHIWLTGKNYSQWWNNKIIINITPYRFLSSNSLLTFLENIKTELDNCVFVSNEKEHHDYFCNKTGINIDYYKPNNFEDIINIIKSCKIGYFGFSSMAVVANALHKSHYLMGNAGIDASYNNLISCMPHVLDIYL